MASAKKCASMALSKPNVQNNQPNTSPPMPFKTNVDVTTRGFKGNPMAASVGKCAAPNASAKRMLAVQNTVGFGLPSASWKSNPPSHASSDRPNRRKSVSSVIPAEMRGEESVQRWHIGLFGHGDAHFFKKSVQWRIKNNSMKKHGQ